jgi:hypothetical protein
VKDLHERSLLDLSEERYDITLFAASEAIEVLPGLVDVERRSLLAVERAEALPTPCSRPLELDIALYDLDDIGAVPNVVDLLPRN